MKLTKHVKEYIEENIDLIDVMNTDSALKFLDNFKLDITGRQEDLKCIVHVLCNTLEVLPDMCEYVKAYQDELDIAYNSVKSINILDIHPKVSSDWCSNKNTGWASVTCRIYLTPPTGSKAVGNSYSKYVPEIHNEVFLADSGFISLYHQDSASFRLSANFPEFPPSEFYKKQQLTTFINEYTNYIKEVYDKLYLLEQSVEWKAVARTVAKELSQFIQKTVSESAMKCYVTIYDLSEFPVLRNELKLEVSLPVKTKINLNITIPYDSDPKNIDVKLLMTNWKKNFEKYVKLNKHKF